LQANSNLGWRDVQHIIARTTDKNDPTDAGWTTNGAGLKINPQYGFGKINAGNAVSLAKMWTNVGSQLSTQSATQSAALSVTSTAFVSTTFTVSSSFTSITKLEHVVLRVTATNANTAGTNNLRIVLVSPSGTESIMAYGRTNTDGANFNDYPLMSVHFWGESPTGVWTVKAKLNGAGDSYTLNSFSLQLMGTGPGCSNCGTTQSGSEATAFMSTLLAAVLALLFLSSLTM
jgi:subtilisin-like proprotein convertase family protein